MTIRNTSPVDMPDAQSTNATPRDVRGRVLLSGRCYRTIKNLCRESVTLERFGVHHRALDDAISQANHLVACLEFLGLESRNESKE